VAAFTGTRQHALELGDDGLERLMACAVDWLAGHTGVDAAVFSPVDRRLNVLTTRPLVVHLGTPRLRLQARGAREAYVHAYHAADPFAPRRWAQTTATVVGVADVGGRAAFSRSLYGAFLAKYGLGAQASIYLRREGRIVATIALLRGSDDSDFSPAVLAQLRRVQPFLETTLALAREHRPPANPRAEMLDGVGLTPREREVARLVAAGATNADIARAMFVSQATVKTHVSRILSKFGVRTRTELMLRIVGGDQSARPNSMAS
jgi:DNA-binding CsgD family transcriptional regulator